VPRVTILYDTVPAGAPADALDVLDEAEAVEQALRDLGWDTDRLEVGLDLEAAARTLRQRRPDLVFNLAETLGGAARLAHFVPAFLDEIGLPYTGSGPDAMATTANKRLAGSILRLARLPVPPAMPRAARTADSTGPWIVKSVWEHASIGIDDESVVPGADEARARIAERRARLGGEWFAEGYIEGREFNLSLLAADGASEVLPPAEIRFLDYPPGKPRIVNYAAKWDPDAFEYHQSTRVFPDARDEPALFAELRRLALACWDLFGMAGYARVDFRVDASGNAWILDVNTNPCLAPDAGFAAAVDRSGATYEQAIARIVGDALARAADPV
jgi:D-alanine-D-alanine ligase